MGIAVQRLGTGPDPPGERRGQREGSRVPPHGSSHKKVRSATPPTFLTTILTAPA